VTAGAVHVKTISVTSGTATRVAGDPGGTLVVTVLELTPSQKETLNEIYERFLGWCDKLGIEKVNIESIAAPK
jgi:ribosomal protein L14